MADDSGWEPILDGALADAAWQAVRDIAKELADGKGVARGASDLALFWAYAAGAFDDEWSAAQYDTATEDLCRSIENLGRGIGLHGGLSGIGWTLAHISDAGAADEILVPIDQLLVRALAIEPWPGDYDLIGGLVGVGVYFLERGEASSAKTGLARVLEHLESLATTTSEGRAYHTKPELLPEHQRVHSPDGYYNCGLAHGMPGVVALLGRVGDAEGCREILRWMQARELTGQRGVYPGSVNPDLANEQATRTAWCYGDPGVAVAAWGASARVGLPVEHWRELARQVATRPFELTGTNDAAICHGGAGLAHICNRWYQTSREPVFRDAARRYVEKLLAMRKPEGLGGFLAYKPELTGEPRWEPAADLVEGAAGIGLVLLGALQPIEPAWDRLFQCDLPIAPGL